MATYTDCPGCISGIDASVQSAMLKPSSPTTRITNQRLSTLKALMNDSGTDDGSVEALQRRQQAGIDKRCFHAIKLSLPVLVGR
jgi:PBP1b-binding outer membrane lipoprotein LpoB